MRVVYHSSQTPSYATNPSSTPLHNPSASTAPLNIPQTLSPSLSSFSRATRKPFKSSQNASVANSLLPSPTFTTFGSTSSSPFPFPLFPTPKPPITITPISILPSPPSPTKSFKVLLSPTGFFSHNTLNLPTSTPISSPIFPLISKILVDSGRLFSSISRGGFRRDLRETVMDFSAPGARRVFLVRVRGCRGRMYWEGVC
ncbi:hypothetical protein L207DRAFT_44183 [Hyaloscypha variabilis F]|uniref:Uncharacterized protein n=1 Tax=Hyaloscypha variabilis (strain UAMH 11265 / GT02V1 / F) TaxID=1149755 RepID=A0A2J6RJV1_HYAVF|nr:hypothetical protein L207DRAFT_44183 [Hyaloscypha variabilis F]